MGLDILTERGQRSLEDLGVAVRLFESNNPGYRYVSTPESMPAAIDGFVCQDGVICAAVEAKCRYGLTLDDFVKKFRNEWLVTMRKLTDAAEVSRRLHVPLCGFLFLVDAGCLMVQRIAESDGSFCVSFRCETTETQRTINGGTALRANAYIDMRNCRVLR